MRRIPCQLTWLTLVVTCSLGATAAERRSPAENAAGSAPAASEPARQEAAADERLREGGVLTHVLGTFQVVGDRITFAPDDRQAALPVLENLALERVAGMLESAAGRVWSVNGMVTEFRGRNYLLLERAVVRARPAQATARP
jgi:hypothetical protein